MKKLGIVEDVNYKEQGFHTGGPLYKEGMEYMKSLFTFGSGISDNFPGIEEMSLDNLLEVEKELLQRWMLPNFYELEDIVEEIRSQFIETNVEWTEKNLAHFLAGCRDVLSLQIRDEYIDYYTAYKD